MDNRTKQPQLRSRNVKLAASLAALVAGMIMLSFAAVPLYALFCRVTGYGGTTRIAAHAPETASTRHITVRFNTDTAQNLPWKFKPGQARVDIRLGEEKLVYFTAHNTSDKPLYGTAIYNVTPHTAAEYFNKIQCFCFENQRLDPGQTMDMPVSFFIDPQIEANPYLKDLQTVTLSYTFFLSKTQNKRLPVNSANAKNPG